MTDLDELLSVLTEREQELISEARHTAGRRVYVIPVGGMRFDIVEECGWDTGRTSLPTRSEVNALIEAGLFTDEYVGNGYAFQISTLGRRLAAELERRGVATPGAVDPASIQWASIERHRRSIHDAWFADGAEDDGVDVAKTSLAALDASTRRAVIRQLAEADMIIFKPGSVTAVWGGDGPGMSDREPDRVRPSAKTSAEYGGWPTRDNAQEQLLAALDAAIADESTPPEERSKLEKVRSQVTELAVGTAWTLLTGWAGLGG